jgi:hypothetical protein
MALRWTAAGMMEAAKGFRRLTGHNCYLVAACQSGQVLKELRLVVQHRDFEPPTRSQNTIQQPAHQLLSLPAYEYARITAASYSAGASIASACVRARARMGET